MAPGGASGAWSHGVTGDAREEISRGKLLEVAAMLGIEREGVEGLIADAGLEEEPVPAACELRET